MTAAGVVHSAQVVLVTLAGVELVTLAEVVDHSDQLEVLVTLTGVLELELDQPSQPSLL